MCRVAFENDTTLELNRNTVSLSALEPRFSSTTRTPKRFSMHVWKRRLARLWRWRPWRWCARRRWGKRVLEHRGWKIRSVPCCVHSGTERSALGSRRGATRPISAFTNLCPLSFSRPSLPLFLSLSACSPATPPRPAPPPPSSPRTPSLSPSRSGTWKRARGRPAWKHPLPPPKATRCTRRCDRKLGQWRPLPAWYQRSIGDYGTTANWRPVSRPGLSPI